MPTAPLHFLAAGDLHVGAAPFECLQTLFAAAAKHGEAAFLAVPGDLTNQALPEQFDALRSLIDGLPFPFLATMGNHDALTGPDEAARKRFADALGVESPSYTRRFGAATFAFLSTDGNIDGCSVNIQRSLPVLDRALSSTDGPVIAFCHAPLSGTVGAAPGRDCFLSDDPEFGLICSADVRAMVARTGVPVVWICGHTHSPLAADGLIGSERAGSAWLHTVNLSCPWFTGRDFDLTEPLALYRFSHTAEVLDVSIEDAGTGAVLRCESLPLI